MKILKLLSFLLLTVNAGAQTAFTLGGYNSTATTITLQFGGGSQLPAAPVTCDWWNYTACGNVPYCDPQQEKILVSQKNGDTLVAVRGFLSAAYPHNTAGTVYAIQQSSNVTPILTPTRTPTNTPTFTKTSTPIPGTPTNTPTITSTPTGSLTVTPTNTHDIGNVTVKNFPTSVPTATFTITPTPNANVFSGAVSLTTPVALIAGASATYNDITGFTLTNNSPTTVIVTLVNGPVTIWGPHGLPGAFGGCVVDYLIPEPTPNQGTSIILGNAVTNVTISGVYNARR